MLSRDSDSFELDLGTTVPKTVRCTLDIRDYEHLAGFSWLLIAANTHLSLAELEIALRHAGPNHKRSKSWIARRRWMFVDTPKTRAGAPKNRDGHEEQVLRFMADNPKMSSRQMAGYLHKIGIARSPTWIRQHRVTSGR